MPKFYFPKKKSRFELNDAGQPLKKKRKHKGLPSGHRHTLTLIKQKKVTQQPFDPCCGSKIPISLQEDTSSIVRITPMTGKQKNGAAQPLSLQQQLAQLENDPKLEALLNRIETRQPLHPQEKAYVTQQLGRIDALICTLGYEYDDASNNGADIMRILKS